MSKYFFLLATLMFLLFTSWSYEKQALSFHFVDEEDNMVLGSYLLKGEKLYSDLFSHHQPGDYILSSGVQKVTESNTLFLLIKKHREAVILWSLFWGLLLIFKFKLPMGLMLLIYEPLKVFLLGNLFLAESLVVYPFVYILGWIFLNKLKLVKWGAVFLGLCFSLSFLLLSPLWPVLFILAIICLRKVGRLGVLGLLGGLILPLIVTLSFISLPDYFYNAFYINFKYYIPANSGPIWQTLFDAFFAPAISLTLWQGRSATLQVIQIITLILFFSWIILIKQKNYKLVSLMFVILGLTNLRYVNPGAQAYSGFHMLPWFVALIFVTIISVKFTVEKYFKLWKLGILSVLVILSILLGVVIYRETSPIFFKKHDQTLDYYINYSRQADIGEAIKIMKVEGETLFVVPDEWLVYWQANISHYSKMVNYYAWMAKVPEIRGLLSQEFSQKLPTYFYCDRCQKGYFGLEEYFDNYQYLKKDGQETKLMVLKDKLQELTMEQKNKLNYYNFKAE